MRSIFEIIIAIGGFVGGRGSKSECSFLTGAKSEKVISPRVGHFLVTFLVLFFGIGNSEKVFWEIF